MENELKGSSESTWQRQGHKFQVNRVMAVVTVKGKVADGHYDKGWHEEGDGVRVSTKA